MNDDRSGIERLRVAVDEVAESLGPPTRTRRRRSRGAVVLAGVGVSAVLVAALWIAWDAERREVVDGANLGVEVRELRLRGREVDPRVFDPAGAGTIVVAPRAREKGE